MKAYKLIAINYVSSLSKSKNSFTLNYSHKTVKNNISKNRLFLTVKNTTTVTCCIFQLKDYLQHVS